MNAPNMIISVATITEDLLFSCSDKKTFFQFFWFAVCCLMSLPSFSGHSYDGVKVMELK